MDKVNPEWEAWLARKNELSNRLDSFYYDRSGRQPQPEEEVRKEFEAHIENEPERRFAPQ